MEKVLKNSFKVKIFLRVIHFIMSFNSLLKRLGVSCLLWRVLKFFLWPSSLSVIWTHPSSLSHCFLQHMLIKASFSHLLSRRGAFPFPFFQLYSLINQSLFYCICDSHCFKKRFYLFTFRERGREGERKRNINVWEIHWSVASHIPPTGDLACNPGLCPDWESNQRPFGLQASAQSTEPHQPGHDSHFNWTFYWDHCRFIVVCVLTKWQRYYHNNINSLHFISGREIRVLSSEWQCQVCPLGALTMDRKKMNWSQVDRVRGFCRYLSKKWWDLYRWPLTGIDWSERS